MPEDREVFAKLTVAENLAPRRAADGDRAATSSTRLFPDLVAAARAARRHALGRPAADGRRSPARSLNDNRLLLVDEPTKGLAPKIVDEVADALAEAAKTVPILLVEQNLEVVRRLAEGVVVIGGGRVVHTGVGRRPARRRGPHPALLGVHDAELSCARARDAREGPMSTLVLTLITGVGLGALYFLVASGL